MQNSKRAFLSIIAVVWLMLPGTANAQKARGTLPSERVPHTDNFNDGKIGGWNVYGAPAVVRALPGNPALQTQGDSQIFWGAANDKSALSQDVTVEGDVSVEHDDANSGFIVRANEQAADNAWTGYYACLRKLGAGYSIVQLYRFPDFVLLQEARVRGTVNGNQLVHLKITCQGPHLWVWANEMSVPAITEYDNSVLRPGFFGLKSENNRAYFDNIVVRTVGETPRAPFVRDWSWMKGAVFITSDSVNSYQMWEEYHPDVVDRELSYAHLYGLNTVEVYLNFLTWQKYGQVYLGHIEDFLQKADKHSLKVTFILFDDVGNIEPPHLAPYPSPVPGVHNSQMQGCPGRDIVDHHYARYRAELKAYVQAIVKPHKRDARIVFWQTCNEPSHATTLPLLADAYTWIKETGCTIPVTATGGGAFYGSYYSDFPTFHSYLNPQAPPAQNMVLADGGPEHVCTETLDRPGVTVSKLVNYFAARKTGWIVWELMIGRDNCRFPWGSAQGAPEPTIPFHGLLYLDGHPWSVADIKAIQGSDLIPEGVFTVNYYGDDHFTTLKKTSVVPRIDFDLNTEPGTNAIDASAGEPDRNWSSRYLGKLTAVQSGKHTLYVDSDGCVRVWLGGKQILDKTQRDRREVSGQIALQGRSTYDLVVAYAHGSGSAHLHVYWSGPGITKRLLAGSKGEKP